MLLTEECKCINWNVAADVSLGCIAHQHCLNRYDFNLCLKTVRFREGSLKSSKDCSRERAQKWRSFVAQLFSFLFSAQERSPRAVERSRERAGTVDFCTSISVRYAGAVPWRTLVNEESQLCLVAVELTSTDMILLSARVDEGLGGIRKWYGSMRDGTEAYS